MSAGSSRVRSHAALSLCVLGALVAQGAPAQLVGERLQGDRRICTYAAEAGPFSGQEGRAIAVSEVENCPVTPPPQRSRGSLPDTAQLRSWNVEAGRRLCTFEQGGEIWVRSVDLDRSCPIVAGLLNAEAN